MTTTDKICFLNVKEGDMITSYIFKGYSGLAEAAAMKSALRSENIQSTVSPFMDKVFTEPKMN